MNGATKYSRYIAITDVFVIAVSLTTVHLLRFDGPANLSVASGQLGLTINYFSFSIALGLLWFFSLWLFQSRNPKLLGDGAAEFIRVIRSSFFVFASLTVLAFVTKTDFSRFFILVGLPVGTSMLILGRFTWRYWLRKKREKGLYSSRVLIAGSLESVLPISKQLLLYPYAGYQIAGFCVPGEAKQIQVSLPNNQIFSFENFADIHQVIFTMKEVAADSILVTASDVFSTSQLKELSWNLDPKNQSLILASSLLDISGPRIHARPVAGLPLMLVEIPSFTGARKVLKRILDLILSFIISIFFFPIMLFFSILIFSSNNGPIFFFQERVGIDGNIFRMIKFRSMYPDAERRLSELKKSSGFKESEVLFKISNDPRVTPLGRFMRKYSIDELPQLLNVLRGDMSIVGPRPPLPSEVALYESHVHRRFLVRPGITGLWQVSGRSMLSWEESVRLDLYYVENWSFIGDLVILWKTIRAVFTHEGAY